MIVPVMVELKLSDVPSRPRTPRSLLSSFDSTPGFLFGSAKAFELLKPKVNGTKKTTPRRVSGPEKIHRHKPYNHIYLLHISYTPV